MAERAQRCGEAGQGKPLCYLPIAVECSQVCGPASPSTLAVTPSPFPSTRPASEGWHCLHCTDTIALHWCCFPRRNVPQGSSGPDFCWDQPSLAKPSAPRELQLHFKAVAGPEALEEPRAPGLSAEGNSQRGVRSHVKFQQSPHYTPVQEFLLQPLGSGICTVVVSRLFPPLWALKKKLVASQGLAQSCICSRRPSATPKSQACCFWVSSHTS